MCDGDRNHKRLVKNEVKDTNFRISSIKQVDYRDGVIPAYIIIEERDYQLRNKRHCEQEIILVF